MTTALIIIIALLAVSIALNVMQFMRGSDRKKAYNNMVSKISANVTAKKDDMLVSGDAKSAIDNMKEETNEDKKHKKYSDSVDIYNS